NARLFVPTGGLTFEEMTKKTLLQVFAIFAVKMRKVSIAVHLQPLLLGAGSQVAFEIAAGMQSHATPIGGRQQRRRYFGKITRAHRVILIVKLAPFRFARWVGPIDREFGFGKSFRPRDRFSGHSALGAAITHAVLHADDLAREPAAEEITQDAAVPAQFAIIIRRAFPDAQCGKVRRA